MDFPQTDIQFDAFYSDELRGAAEFHFTPMETAFAAADFLVSSPSDSVLDIGSGSGKFCLIGAAHSAAHFTGVELRKSLHEVAVKHKGFFGVENCSFINSDIQDIDFQMFTAFYIFNPFYEYLFPKEKITEELDLKKSKYAQYSSTTKKKLEQMPVGTKLATYFSHGDELPCNYQEVKKSTVDKLRFWVKTA